jgi:hypothetical protein
MIDNFQPHETFRLAYDYYDEQQIYGYFTS